MLGAILGAAGSVLSSIMGNNAAEKSADKQARLQKEFAQKGVQWKVADAVKAGLHPLAALGANTMSYSPISVGSSVPDLGAMGQEVGRSIEATQNGSERATGKIGLLQLERAGLENDLLRTQIASENARLRAQLGPPMPTDGGSGQIIPGQGNSLIESKVVPPQLMKGLNVGVGMNTNPHFSDAQSYEDRYGEVGGSALGLGNIPADIIYNWLFKKRPSTLKGSRVPGRYQAK